ncbi:MAG: hypothetical protein AW09_001242 [Candidatus Accumulibacter phosphatis]|uniref:Uncharacterized protein n=1 Tax=Candidatus Accumulibacter phosphatis TaxID=327160 RepID=A0A080LXS7_9PROT|nr:MAG: hypothetical protein AW09_001242 [Candidatus Accumulibacter phosphatis]
MAKNHDAIEHYNRFHAVVYGPEGALDQKTHHLICSIQWERGNI